MPKRSKLEPPLVGSVVSNACGPKRTDQWPTKHYQAGRDSKERGPIDGRTKSVIFARKEDDNTTVEAVGWPRWEKYSRSGGASEDDSTMACRRDRNESEDGNAKRVTDEGGDASHHDGLGERGQPSPNVHMAGKGGLSKSACWDRLADGDERRESGGWPTWPQASSKTTRQCTNHQNNKGCWNQPKGWTAAEVGSTMACKRGWNESGDGREKRENGGDAFDHDGRDGWRQSRSNIHIADEGRFSKSASWDRPKCENVKRENDGWPGAMSKPTRQCTSIRWTASDDGSSMACKRGWNESGDGKEKMDNGGDAFDRDGIRTVDRGGSSKSTSWDREKDENAERVSDGWRRWPGATYKTTRQCSSHQNKKGCWDKSKGWTTSEDDTAMACAKVWNDSGDGEEKRVTADASDAFDLDGHDGWRSSSSNFNLNPKSRMSKPTPWDQAKGDDEKRENDEWRRWPGTGGDPWKQIGPTAPPKAGKRKFGSATVVRVEDSITRKSKWGGVPDFSDPDASKQRRSRWGPSLSSTSGYNGNQSGKGGWRQSWGRIASDHGGSLKENNGGITDLDQSDDPWVEHRPMMLPKGDWKKSASRTESGVGDFASDRRRWGPDFNEIGHDPWEQLSSPEFGNSFREGINELKQNTHTLLPKIGGKRPFRGGRRPYHFSEHEHHQSNDSYKKGAGGFSACYGDSQMGRSERGSQVRRQIGRKHPDRDTDEPWESKKAQYLQQDRTTSFEDPRKQRDHLQDVGSRSHGSRNDGAAKDKLFQNGTSCDGFLRERCSRHDSSEGHRGRLTKDESEEIYHGRTGSDHGQSQQSAQSSNPNVQTQQSDSNPKDEVRNREHQAMFNFLNSSTAQASIVCASAQHSHSEPVDVEVNGESSGSKHGKEEGGANGELKGGVDDKGTRMFKFAVAEFVKEIIKPVWKEGRLSKEAHKTVVKKVVDKVVGVLGANVPQTQERIALYLSYAKDKLHKLVQDYLEMFINT